jgi:hypothetical protein
MKRGEARSLVIRVSTSFDQLDREFKMAVADGKQQGTHAFVDRPITRVVDGPVRPVRDSL